MKRARSVALDDQILALLRSHDLGGLTTMEIDHILSGRHRHVTEASAVRGSLLRLRADGLIDGFPCGRRRTWHGHGNEKVWICITLPVDVAGLEQSLKGTR